MLPACAIPPLPVNEPLRLKELRSYEILDTPREAVHDRITRLAAAMFDTPIALITLLDETRQWFKSRYGLNVASTGREVAFCAYTILSDEVMVIPDARKDERFAANPLVTGPPGIRFYAGAPLRTQDGLILGTLCVIDDKPRFNFGQTECSALKDLADLAMHEFVARRAERRLAATLEEKEALLREIHHRVKNNLQSLWGLLQLEKSRMQDTHARSRLNAISQRITVMGTIHKQLYASNSLSGIDLASHLEELCQGLAGLYGCPPDVVIDVDAEPLECGLDTAIPLGLIANEAISNSLKHGFPPGRGGRVLVSLHHLENGEWELAVADDGIGMAGGDTAGIGGGQETHGIGMTLIQALATQIGASVSVEDAVEAGFRLRVRFRACA